jgi:uracil-DNA glycosylase family 4
MSHNKKIYLNTKSLDYLRQLGIPTWVPRDAQLIHPQQQPSSHQDDASRWENLRQAVAQCTACGLDKTRTQTVFGVGNQQAELLIIGEAPGYHEDQKGEPFVGAAGKLLDAMLKAIQLDRQTVYIANILKCRPPNNRDPKPEEVQLCTPFLLQQIQLIQPKLILAVGRIAAQFLLQSKTSLSRLRGKMHEYSGTPLLVTYHPAYLLRNPQDKAKAWEDLKKVRDFLHSS